MEVFSFYQYEETPELCRLESGVSFVLTRSNPPFNLEFNEDMMHFEH